MPIADNKYGCPALPGWQTSCGEQMATPQTPRQRMILSLPASLIRPWTTVMTILISFNAARLRMQLTIF